MKKISAALVGSLALSAALFAEGPSVESTKTSPFSNVTNNAYSSFELRHYLTKKDEGATPRGQGRLTVGTKTWKNTDWNSELNTRIVFGLNTKPGSSTVVENRGTRLEAELTVFENEFVKFMPFLYVKTPLEKYGTSAQLGLDIPVQYAMHSDAGVVTVGAEYFGSTFVGSRIHDEDKIVLTDADKIPAGKRSSLGLAATQTPGTPDKVDPNALSFDNELDAFVSFEPSLINGLSIELRQIHDTKYTPIMAYSAEEDRVIAKKGKYTNNAYNTEYERTHRLTAFYNVSKTVYVFNQLSVSNKENNNGQRQFENVLTVGTNLL